MAKDGDEQIGKTLASTVQAAIVHDGILRSPWRDPKYINLVTTLATARKYGRLEDQSRILQEDPQTRILVFISTLACVGSRFGVRRDNERRFRGLRMAYIMVGLLKGAHLVRGLAYFMENFQWNGLYRDRASEAYILWIGLPLGKASGVQTLATGSGNWQLVLRPPGNWLLVCHLV